tara:strand:+ start:7686 stop:8930 length:1245 start_codon:yes stop_codon:yes gene_type:complete
MPKVQLIRRDGEIIELNATSVGFSVQRGVAIWAPPIVGVRMGLDLNNNLLTVAINGVIVDDENTSGSSSAVAELDLSRPTGLFDSWFKQQQAQGNTTIASIVTALHGKEITFRTASQVAAGAGEDTTLRFYSSSVPAATVATNSIIPVNISGTINHTGDIAIALNSALSGASVKVATVTTAISTLLTITQGAGIKINSGAHQSVGTLSNEKLTITNITKSANGNGVTTKQGDLAISASQDWTASFHTTNFTGGVTGSKKSKGDKIQDLINMTVNASAGGGMLSPQSFTGDLIEMPDSLANFDIAKLLMIEESDSVKKYIVGLRIPYESMVTATGANTEEMRQFVLPSGPGTDFSSEKNLQAFDPLESGERPNPFFRQGVALAGVVQTFEPSYEAGDSVWTFSLGFSCCEQLLGI